MQTTKVEKHHYKIGDLMEFFGLERGTLNHYININLIRPSYKNGKSGHRIFDEDTIKRLRRIEVLKNQNLKLTLIKIKDILDNELPFAP